MYYATESTLPKMKREKYRKKNWKVSMIELKSCEGCIYKVTRSLVELSVAETRIFKSKKSAMEQFRKWLE